MSWAVRRDLSETLLILSAGALVHFVYCFIGGVKQRRSLRRSEREFESYIVQQSIPGQRVDEYDE